MYLIPEDSPCTCALKIIIAGILISAGIQNLKKITIFKFLHNIRTSICIKKITKMENSLLAIFDKIWPKTLYYSTGSLA